MITANVFGSKRYHSFHSLSWASAVYASMRSVQPQSSCETLSTMQNQPKEIDYLIGHWMTTILKPSNILTAGNGHFLTLPLAYSRGLCPTPGVSAHRQPSYNRKKKKKLVSNCRMAREVGVNLTSRCMSEPWDQSIPTEHRRGTAVPPQMSTIMPEIVSMY